MIFHDRAKALPYSPSLWFALYHRYAIVRCVFSQVDAGIRCMSQMPKIIHVSSTCYQLWLWRGLCTNNEFGLISGRCSGAQSIAEDPGFQDLGASGRQDAHVIPLSRAPWGSHSRGSECHKHRRSHWVTVMPWWSNWHEPKMNDEMRTWFLPFDYADGNSLSP